MGWRKNFCYWLIVTGEVHRVRAAVRKHEPGSAGQDEAKEPKKQIGATPPIYDTFESVPKVGCWRMECPAEGIGPCNAFDGGKWMTACARTSTRCLRRNPTPPSASSSA